MQAIHRWIYIFMFRSMVAANKLLALLPPPPSLKSKIISLDIRRADSQEEGATIISTRIFAMYRCDYPMSGLILSDKIRNVRRQKGRA